MAFNRDHRILQLVFNARIWREITTKVAERRSASGWDSASGVVTIAGELLAVRYWAAMS
jgi:hypothetical protein